MKLIFLAGLVLALLTACASGPQLPIQYATLKMVERDHFTADMVIERADQVQKVLLADADLTLADLQSRAREVVGYESLAASDRLLIDTLMGDVSHDLGIILEAPLSDEQRQLISQRLEWVAQAATMAD